MKKKSFKDILNNLTPLKILDLGSHERLPHIFDLMWDIKYPIDLIGYLVLHKDNREIWQYINSNGFDGKKINQFLFENREKLLDSIDNCSLNEDFKNIKI